MLKVSGRMAVLRYLALAAALLPAAMTLLSLVRHPHWLFRMWDFPRVQIAALALIGAGLWTSFYFRGSPADLLILGAVGGVVVYQLYRIFPYTPLSRLQSRPAHQCDQRALFSLLMSNVLMENEQHERFIQTVRQYEPDIVLAVEVNARWAEAIAVLDEAYPHRVKQPQENYYGMLVLSKLPLIDPEVSFLVQDDIPSIHAGVRLQNGVVIQLHGIHPRPPEPLRNQRSSPRDAELVVVGKSIEKQKDVPTVVAGDLNDVAWSETSQLFVRVSGLLDPRVGRGLFNSYNAHNPFFRFPLDHVFHSTHFELVDLRRLPSIGSDHFPILITLAYEPHGPEEQHASRKKAGDDELAVEKLEKEAEDAATGADRPNDD